MTKATAETILADSARIICRNEEGRSCGTDNCGCTSHYRGTAYLVLEALPLTLEQLAALANGEADIAYRLSREELLRRLEARMTAWDSWRKYIANGGGGSWPRDAYESFLDFVSETASAALAEEPKT